MKVNKKVTLNSREWNNAFLFPTLGNPVPRFNSLVGCLCLMVFTKIPELTELNIKYCCNFHTMQIPSIFHHPGFSYKQLWSNWSDWAVCLQVINKLQSSIRTSLPITEPVHHKHQCCHCIINLFHNCMI